MPNKSKKFSIIVPVYKTEKYLKPTLDAIEDQLLGHSQTSLSGALEAVIQDGLLHGLVHPVGMRTLGSGQPVDEPIGAESLVIPSDFVELLP